MASDRRIETLRIRGRFSQLPEPFTNGPEKEMSFKSYILFAAFSLTSSVSATAVNLVTNGDFEAGNTGFTSEFAFSPGNIRSPATYDITTNARNSHSSARSYGDNTTGSGLYLAANGSTSTDTVVWSQDILVAPNTPYEFGLAASSWFSPADLQLVINGDAVGATYSTPSDLGIWELTAWNWNSGGSVLANIELVNTSSGFGGNDFGIDDIRFEAVPEPASLIVLGLGGVALLSKRRK